MPDQTTWYETITVKYVNPPKPGAFSGSVKDDQGRYWSVPEEHMSYFQAGETYQIGYWQNESKGKVYNNINEVNGHALQRGQDAQPKPVQRQQPKPAPRTGQAPKPLQQAPQPEYGAITAKDKLIWVESYVKSFAPIDKELSGTAMVHEAIEIYDKVIQAWLQGQQPGPGDRERAVITSLPWRG